MIRLARLSLKNAFSGARNRNIISGVIGLLFAKGVSFATLFLTVPMLLRYLGQERFGVWITLTSLSAILVVSDFGIGNGIKNEIARAYGAEDDELFRKIVVNGIATQTGLSALFITSFFLIKSHINWYSLLNVQEVSLRSEVNSSASVFLLCSLVSIPLSIGSRIRAGMQREDINGIWSSAGSLGAIAGLFIGLNLQFGLTGLMACFIGVPVLVNAISTIHTLFVYKEKLLMGRGDFSIRTMQKMLLQGLRYLGVTLVFIVTFASDNIIIAKILGPESVAVYSVADRLFQVISVFLTMVNAPFWPAYSAANASGDHQWVLRTFKRAFLANLIFCCGAAAVLLIFAKPIFEIWLGGAIMPSLSLMLAIASRRIVEALYSASTVLLNSLDLLIVQIFWGVIMSAVAVLLRLLLISGVGLEGGPIGLTIAVALCGFIPTVYALRRLRKLST